MKSKRLNPFQVLRDQLAIMSFYERFEQVVALVLSAVIAVIIVVSLFQLISIVFTLLVLDAFNPLDHKVFQSVFGMIMTLLIAMEFKHSIVRVALRRDSIIRGQDGGPDRGDRTLPQVRDPRLRREPRKDSRAGRRHAGSGCDLLAAAQARRPRRRDL